MSTPFLATKLYMPPPRPHLVPRPRLIQRLDEGLRLGRRLTLVSAPAGYGKTTLLSEWMSRLGQSVGEPEGKTDPRPLFTSSPGHSIAWLSLDEGDNEPLTLISYLIAALQQVDDRIGQSALRLLDSPSPPPADSLVTAFINDVAAQPSAFVLVLDDYHVLSELAIHEVVGFILEHQPAQMHLVILTRQDPPLPLARLRARDQMSEIRARDLRFTYEEAAVFLRQSMGLDLAQDEVAALETRTEGWIAGLQLAALSLEREVDRSSFIRAFAGDDRHVRDYLVDEVLSRQSEVVQGFLLQTSLLERLSGPLCDFLLRGDSSVGDSQEILEYLEQGNLFLVPLDNRRQWYRFHHLFADLLRLRLNRDHPEWISPLHRRAAAWYEENGFAFEAIHHILAVQDFDLAASMIERALRQTSTWIRSDITRVRRWLKALPDEVMEERSWLRLMALRLRYATGELADVESVLQEIEDSGQTAPVAADAAAGPEVDRLADPAVADRAVYALTRGEVRQAIDFARQALAHLPEDDAMGRLRAGFLLSFGHYLAGNVAEAGRILPPLVADAAAAGIPFAAIGAQGNLAEVQWIQGRLHQAAQSCQQARQMGGAGGVTNPMVGLIGLTQSKILYEWNDLPAAARCLQEDLERLGQAGLTDSFGTGHAILALIQQGRGDDEGALALIRRAIQAAEDSNVERVSVRVAAYQALIWLAQGKLDWAKRWAEDYRQLGATEYLREFEDLTLARVLLVAGRPAEARALLEAMLPPAEEAGRVGRVIEILTLQALALEALDEGKGALEALRRVLILAEPEGYVRTFLDAGKPLARLLLKVIHLDLPEAALAYVHTLLAAFGEHVPEQPRDQPSPLIEPLSDRELEVLHLLAERLSNREIAERLFIALPTVKSHTRSIYGKLGVGGRREAVARARALGLLPA